MENMRPGLRHGDLTTTGGVIIATGKMRFHGKEVAAEGDLATCPACKSVGYPWSTTPIQRLGFRVAVSLPFKVHGSSADVPIPLVPSLRRTNFGLR